jgi:hypothetical protein
MAVTPGVITLKTMQGRGREVDGSGQYPRQTSAKWASSASFPRANGGVWAVRGDIVKQVAQRASAAVNGEALATSCPGVSARLAGRALVRACARLGVFGRVAFCTM